jgi:heat shock protein beta
MLTKFRFFSTHDPTELTSLDEYISRMKDDQDTILYLPGDSKAAVLNSPIIKKYTKQGFEVLILADPIDEFTFQHLGEYEKRKVKSIAKDDVSILDNTETDRKKFQKLKEMYKPLTDFIRTHLDGKVEKVTVSNKLVDAPLFIFTSQYGYSAQMEKINKAQAFANQAKAESYMSAKKILEINPHHPVMKVMLERVKDSEDGASMDEASSSYVDLLYQMALLNSGFQIDEPHELTLPLEKLIRVGFGVARDQEIEEIELDLSEDQNSEEEAQEESEEEAQEEPEEEGE